MSEKGSKQAGKLVIDYLVKENRPFSANDICANLNGQLGKTAVVNVLEELASDKKIVEKVYGKQKVYMALQGVDVSNLKLELRQLDEKIALSGGDLNRLKAENGRMEGEINARKEQVSISELEARLAELTEEVDTMNSKLKELKSANVKVISKEEKSKIQKENEKLVSSWRKYKRIANEMMATILENCNMKKSELIDELGIVSDEQENVKIPAI